jgi:DNA-directed RNA polymerase subunit H (RpoH/RPB5)
MQNNSSLISSIHKSRTTILELMSKQGYDIQEYDHSTLTDTNAKYANNQLDMLFDKPKDSTKNIHKTYINYSLERPTRPPQIQDIVEDLFNVEDLLQKEDTLMIVTKDEPSENVLNNIKHIWEKDGIFIILQNIKRLQFNILNHTIVPEHRIMSDAEIKDIMEKHNIHSIDTFPDISRFDPVAIAIGMRPGQVCEIIRPSKTSVTGKYYRTCV